MEPNRWSTPVIVEVFKYFPYRDTSEFMHFTDLQMAYLWIKSDIQNHYISSFEKVYQKLDQSYQDVGDRAYYKVAQTPDYKYIVYYNLQP